MRDPQLKTIKVNYRKNVLEIALCEGGKTSRYSLPFAVFRNHKIGVKNKFKAIKIDEELNGAAASFVLEDGSKGDFPADLVLYYCDPTYDWSPLNQLKKALKDQLKVSKLSVRVIADALNTSPAQVIRLLEENKGAKQLSQLFQLAELTGHRIQLNLKKKIAA